jgi:hypothetical protein
VKHSIPLMAALLLIAAPLMAEQGAAPSAETTRVVPMTLQPAPVNRPELKIALMPDYLDQAPGNAAILYAIASLQLPRDGWDDLSKKLIGWVDLAPKDLPREEVRRALDGMSGMLRDTELAAFREQCDWDLPIRSEGFKLRIPHLARMRDLARCLAVRIRLNVAEGRHEEVARDLAVGFSMARHAADSPMVISALVGNAIANLMTAQVEAYISSPGSPNLYWALTQLPSPFIDMHKAMSTERASLFLTSPECRDPRNARLTPAQWDRFFLDGAELFYPGRTEAEKSQMVEEGVAKVLPQAKKYLLEHGTASDRLGAMPGKQIVLIYWMDHYVLMRDELFKWFGLPYWQAWEGLEKSEKYLESLGDAAIPASGLLPALAKVYAQTTTLDRRIAGLRCIEAVRLYAAGHDGKLPASLADISEVPIPLDPITGKTFQYRIEGNRAILEWAPAPGLSPKNGARYELTIAK